MANKIKSPEDLKNLRDKFREETELRTGEKEMKIIVSKTAATIGHFQILLIASKVNAEVITIVSVTAMPYAAARLLEFLNSNTNRAVAINRIQFSWGMYICPFSSSEVCIILTLGRKPNWDAC